MKPNPRYRMDVTDLEHCLLVTQLYGTDRGVQPLVTEKFFKTCLDEYRKAHKRPPYMRESVEYRVWVIERNIYATKHTVQALKAFEEKLAKDI